MDINTAPTKGNLMAIQNTLAMSRQGYELMDRKRLILMNEIQNLVSQAKEVQEKLSAAYEKAYEALEAAEEDLGIAELEDASRDVPISNDLDVRVRSVMGSEVPSLKYERGAIEPAYSIYATSLSVDQARFAFEEVAKLQVQLAQVENAAYRLAKNIQKTRKRVNALENITIPQLEDAEKAINSSLEEKEREEFIRLKVVKRILNEKNEAENQALAQEQAEKA